MQWLSWDRNLKTRLIGESLFHALFWMYFPFITLYFSNAFGKNIAGVLMTVPPLVGIIGSLLGGHLADRFGRRPIMLLGAFIQVVMFALFSMSISHWMDYLAYIGIGFGGSIYGPASFAMVADITLEKDRRRVFATFVTATNIGAVIGPALGSIFFFHFRNELLWTCTLVTLLYSIAIIFTIRETLPKTVKKAKTSNTIILILKEQWQSYYVIFRDKVFFIYIIAGVLITIAFVQLNLYLAVYVKEFVPTQTLLIWKDWSHSITNTGVFGWMLGLNGLLFVICSLSVTKWFEHWSDRDTLIISAILFGLGMFFVGLTTNIWLLLIFTVIFTLGELICSPVANSFVSKYAPEDARGQYMAASNLQFSVGRFLAPVTIILSEWLPPIGVFGFILLCTWMSALLYVKIFKMISSKYTEKKGTTINS